MVKPASRWSNQPMVKPADGQTSQSMVNPADGQKPTKGYYQPMVKPAGKQPMVKPAGRWSNRRGGQTRLAADLEAEDLGAAGGALETRKPAKNGRYARQVRTGPRSTWRQRTSVPRAR